ncbi:hypothetical protein SAMN05428945_5845 [Streptomyces sp. 2224.1]|nr:hypothetical protein BX261_6707 [Streptomyces sp. 2321.6]SDQ78488.1 hypothetical protein SAMN05216511_0544 [Streptomyces sp. KS_16]SED55993.1 hypothetical protein SAMN05428954_0523 [Streptomyces sp. 2112.3]SED87071.1 hypothetical protein SAMN05428945_5845 [Streptomyces sp. 2224.1]SNC73702.1 hypothetical protein SAMN06272741_6636 [Streptomyces sp. 2114.4]
MGDLSWEFPKWAHLQGVPLRGVLGVSRPRSADPAQSWGVEAEEVEQAEEAERAEQAEG